MRGALQKSDFHVGQVENLRFFPRFRQVENLPHERRQ
jgi:hypothetical protein